MNITSVTTQQQLDGAFAVRKAVFVEEQHVPLADEFDEHEETAQHIVIEDGKRIVATARWRNVDGVGKLERICVLPSHRQFGLGKKLVMHLEQLVREAGLTKVKLHGQTHAQRFYEQLGYTTASDVFDEDGIPHVLMVKQLG